MSQILRQSTQVIVRIGPAVAVGDGFTPVVTLDLSTADEAELLKANTTTTTSIAAATFAAITGCDGWYGLTLTTSLTDTVGCLDVMVNDDSLILPIFARFQVIEEAAYDAIYATSAAPATTTSAVGSVTGAVGSVTGLTAADVGAIKTKTDFLPSATAGAAGGVFIAGSNAATTFATLTVTGATTLTGNVLLSDGLTVAAPSTAARPGISVTGNGAGAGIISTGGTSGIGISAVGGSIAGHGLSATSSAANSHAIRAAASGSATSDGLSATGGASGVGIRMGSMTVTGATNLTGAVSLGSTLAVSGNVTFSGAAGFAITNGITANITGNLSGSVGSLTANNDKTGYVLSAAGSAALTEGYAADGGEGTLPQLLYMIQAYLMEKTISGTTLTANKLDGATPAATFTLDSATAPTSITRSG